MFINADAAGLMKTFNQVDRRLARASSEFTKPGAKLALGFLGVQNALSAVTNEVRFVVQNIESIPGVPAETQASIITMRDNLASAKNWIDGMTAGIVGFGAQMAQAIGVTAAGLMGSDDTSALSRQETPDEIARARDPQFDAKIDAARSKLAEMRKQSAIAGQSEADQIKALRQEAERYETYSQTRSINAVQSLEAQAKAQENLTKAAGKMADLQKQLADSEKEVSKSLTGAHVAKLSRTDAIAGLENRSQQLFMAKAATNQDPNVPEAVQQNIDLNKELADVQERLGKLYEKNADSAKNFANTVSSGFVDAVFAGQSFGDTLKDLAGDIAKVIVKQMFLNTVMAMMGGGGSGFGGTFAGMMGFADGGRPPIGRASIVGERGPELFVPDVGGRIIPNHKLGGSGTTQNFNFSPTISAGVTRQELSAMMPGMFERFSGMVADKASRGGGYRKAWA